MASAGKTRTQRQQIETPPARDGRQRRHPPLLDSPFPRPLDQIMAAKAAAKDEEEDGEGLGAGGVAECKDDDQLIGGSGDYKPGQKFPTPAPANGDRVFYESLLRQLPSSEMAQDWCVHYGVLPWEEAEKLYRSICKRKGEKPKPSPAKPTATTAAEEKAAATGKGSKKNKKSSVEDDSAAAGEGAGKSKKAKTKSIVEDDIPVDSGLGPDGVGYQGIGVSTM